MPDGPRVVLHLGAHKTGTSLLQKYMRDRPKVVARMGAAYVSRSSTNTLIDWGQVPQKHPELLRRAVLEAARPALSGSPKQIASAGKQLLLRRGRVRTVIVSHENSIGVPFEPQTPGLYPHVGACAEGLRNSVGDLSLRVVFYLRAQDEFLESYYLQTVHQGGTASFDEWLAGIDLKAISWAPIVDTLVDNFGEDRVVIRDFAEIRGGQNEFITSFLKICDPTAEPDVAYPAKRNFSVSQQGLDLALTINPLLTTTNQRRATRKFLQTYFSNRSGSRPALLTAEGKAELQTRYSPENADILARLREVRD